MGSCKICDFRLEWFCRARFYRGTKFGSKHKFVLRGILLGSAFPKPCLYEKMPMYQIWYIGIFIFKFFSRQLLFHHFMCNWNENSVQKLHNKAIINFLWFVSNREILNFRQTFLEDTLIFVKKMYVVSWERGIWLR